MRSCWYADKERSHKRGVLAVNGKHEEGGERGFSRKKFWEDIGLEARDFSEKIFLEISKFCATSVAPRAAYL